MNSKFLDEFYDKETFPRPGEVWERYTPLRLADMANDFVYRDGSRESDESWDKVVIDGIIDVGVGDDRFHVSYFSMCGTKAIPSSVLWFRSYYWKTR